MLFRSDCWRHLLIPTTPVFKKTTVSVAVFSYWQSEEFCQPGLQAGLTPATSDREKTTVLEFGALCKAEVCWKGLEEEEYKYLGMLVEKGGAWKKNKDQMLRKAK